MSAYSDQMERDALARAEQAFLDLESLKKGEAARQQRLRERENVNQPGRLLRIVPVFDGLVIFLLCLSIAQAALLWGPGK